MSVRGSRVTKKYREFSNLSGNGQSKTRKEKKMKNESDLNEKPFTVPLCIFTTGLSLTKFTYRMRGEEVSIAPFS